MLSVIAVDNSQSRIYIPFIRVCSIIIYTNIIRDLFLFFISIYTISTYSQRDCARVIIYILIHYNIVVPSTFENGKTGFSSDYYLVVWCSWRKSLSRQPWGHRDWVVLLFSSAQWHQRCGNICGLFPSYDSYTILILKKAKL